MLPFVLLSIALSAPHPSNPQAAYPVLWTWPVGLEHLDLELGPGGADGIPKPPFAFVRELYSGTNAKVLVRDAAGDTWALKWGDEARAELFSTRLAWALGYYVEPTYLVKSGRILKVRRLGRASRHVGRHGDFTDARFQLWPRDVRLLDEKHSWRWDDNPFVGEPWLDALRVLTALTSNWDDKDLRDVGGGGSNTGIFVRQLEGLPVLHYAVTDWGATMGRWGGALGRSKWDCKGYTEQSAKFVRGVADGMVQLGYRGKHTDLMIEGISVSDVDWLMHLLGRLSDGQIRAALRATGAGEGEVECFAAAVRDRIDQLAAVVREAGGTGAVAAFGATGSPVEPARK